MGLLHAPEPVSPDAKTAAPFGQSISIRCFIRDGVIVDVGLEPRRQIPVGRLLVGKTPDVVMPPLGVLFSVCRHAHGLAASRALAMAQDKPLSPEEIRRIEMLRDLEIVREHGLNLIQSVPPGAIAPDSARGLVNSVRALSEFMVDDSSRQHDDVLQRETLEAVLQRFFGDYWGIVDPGLDDVLAWSASGDSPAAKLVGNLLRPGWAAFGACASPALHRLPVERLEAMLGACDPSAFARTPTWDGLACESTSFTRQAKVRLIVEATGRFGNGLLARTLARMVEIKALVKGLRCSAESGFDFPSLVSGGQGIGMAQVEASRGRLIHRVSLETGRVKDYRILAPTEWNFHPKGLVRNALFGVSVSTVDEFQAKVLALLRSIDPCVQFDLSFVEEI